MYIKNNNSKSGFTLIEVMIAMTLFTTIMIIGIGAVLAANSVHKKTQGVRAAMDTLNFIMEDMARNLKLGYNYECGAAVPTSQTTVTPVPTDCVNGASLAFNSSDNGIPIVYAVGSFNSPVSVFKSKNGEVIIRLTSDQIVIDQARSGFDVIGAEFNPLNPPDDFIQPRVIIRLAGTVTSQGQSSEFNLETSVSQRLLDI